MQKHLGLAFYTKGDYMDKKYKNEELPLRLKDIICYLLEKRNSILVFTLLIGLLIISISIVKNYYADKNQTYEEYLRKNISTQRIQIVNGISAQEISYKKLIDSEGKYINNSLLMSLDWENVTHLSLQYSIINDSDNSENVQSLLQVYASKINNDSFYQMASQQTNVDKNDIIDIIDVTSGVPQQDNTVININTGGDEGQISAQLNHKNVNDNPEILTVNIIGPDASFCKSIADCVTSTIEQNETLLNDQIGQHKINLLSESIFTSADSAIQSKQIYELSSLSNNRKALDALNAELSSEEAQYVNYLIQKATSNTVSDVVTVSVKDLIKGFLTGFVLMILFWCIRYINCKKLLNLSTIEDVYYKRVYALRTKSDSRLHKTANVGIEKYKYSNTHVFNENELIDVINSEISAWKITNSIRKVILTSSDFSKFDPKLLKLIQNSIREKEIAVMLEDHIAYNPDAIKEIDNTCLVIIFEKINESALSEIDLEMKYLYDKKAYILGSIVVL